MRGLNWTISVVIVGLLATACDQCLGCGAVDIATLVQTQGKVARDFAKAERSWKPASQGDGFQVGDGLRTHAKSTAVAQLFDGSRLQLGADTIIRFRAQPSSQKQQAKLDLQAGEAILETGLQPLTLDMKMGKARIGAKSRVRLVASVDDPVMLDVEMGNVELDTSRGKRSAKAGERLRAMLGGVVIEEAPKRESADATKKKNDNNELSSAALDVSIGKGEIRVRGVGDKDWRQISLGNVRLEPGTQIEVPKNAVVEVKRGKRRSLLYGEGLYVVSDERNTLVRIMRGGVDMQGNEEDARVLVPGGDVTARGDVPGGSRSKVTLDQDGKAKVIAVKGRIKVVYRDPSKESETLKAGQDALIAPTQEDGLNTEETPKSYPVLIVRGGESFTVRDPSPPVLIGFDVSSCEDRAMLEVMDQRKKTRVASRLRGRGQINALFERGYTRYRVRCLRGNAVVRSSRTTSLRVMRDTGKTRLPDSAPSTSLDVDGRNYTVMYQNLLPSIVVNWTRAPRNSGPYYLEIRSNSGSSKTLRTLRPTHRFNPGDLNEGTYKLSFRATRQNAKSPASTLRIRFDNAAPKASLSSPNNASFKPGDKVRVEGVTVKGWNVMVNGKTLSTDDNARFNSTVTVPKNVRGLAVRLINPRRGIHYYTRRTASAD